MMSSSSSDTAASTSSSGLSPLSIYILFGSQTGNAQEIARLLTSECLRRFPEPFASRVRCLSLAQYVDIHNGSLDSFARETSLAVIICSTTGNGDPPDNALRFFRLLERRKDARVLSGLRYSVLGLGDTNYDNFNKAAKVR